MMAGVVGELEFGAGRAAVEMPALARGAAGEDGADGATLFG